MRRKGYQGYTLVELLAVMAVMIILAAVSEKVYFSFVEKAKVAELYEKGRLIRQAQILYELEDNGGEGWRFGDPELYYVMLKPNEKKSVLYPYVGEYVQDCIYFEVKMKKNAGGKYNLTGFEYETETHRLIWKDPDTINVVKKEN